MRLPSYPQMQDYDSIIEYESAIEEYFDRMEWEAEMKMEERKLREYLEE